MMRTGPGRFDSGPRALLRPVHYQLKAAGRRNAFRVVTMPRGIAGYFPLPVMVKVTVPAFVTIANVADRAPFAVGANE